MEVSEHRGYLILGLRRILLGPTMLGSIFGSPGFGNPHIFSLQELMVQDLG